MLRNLLDISEVVASDLPGMLPVWPFLPNQVERAKHRPRTIHDTFHIKTLLLNTQHKQA